MDVFAREFMGALPLLLVGTTCAVMACVKLHARERRYALIAYALHVVASFVQWWLSESYFVQETDANFYLRTGGRLAQLLQLDFSRYAPELLKLAIHQECRLPVETWPGSTGTTMAIAGIFAYAVGPSLLLLFLLASWIAWFGQVACYRVAREEAEPEDRPAALMAFLFVPSLNFWGALFAKEALVFGAFGLLLLCSYRVVRQGRWTYLPGAIFGGGVVAYVKSYTLVPFVLGLAAFTYASLARRGAAMMRLRPLHLALAAGVALGGVVAMGTVFPEYSVGKITETVAQQREGWKNVEGGSNTDMTETRTGLAQVAALPLALISTLFRPAVFEVRNALSLTAAMETTALSVGILSLLRRWRRFRGAAFLGSPILVFSVVFVVAFGAAVGMTTGNFGSLSRYRVPMMPFYVFALLAALRRASAEQESSAPTDESPDGDGETGEGSASAARGFGAESGGGGGGRARWPGL